MNAVRRSAAALVAVGAAIMLGTTACSDNTSPTVAALSVAQADSVSQVLTADAQGEIDFAAEDGAAGYLPGAGPALTPPPACVSRSPVPPTNSDGDGVPDSVRLAFDNCVVNFLGSSDTLRGTIDILDPTPSATDHAITHRFTDLARIHVGPAGREASITVNGTRQISGDSAQLALTSTDFQTDFQWRNGATATHLRSWSVQFTADVAGSIQFDSPLPAGTLAIQGSSSWTRGANTWTIVASTPVPLHLDPTCNVRPKFDAGTFQAEVTRNGNTSNVTIQFTACGQYTVTRS
jgi:hypothetical protein